MKTHLIDQCNKCVYYKTRNKNKSRVCPGKVPYTLICLHEYDNNEQLYELQDNLYPEMWIYKFKIL